MLESVNRQRTVQQFLFCVSVELVNKQENSIHHIELKGSFVMIVQSCQYLSWLGCNLNENINVYTDFLVTQHTALCFELYRLAALRSLTKRLVWAQTSLVRTLWWPSLTASLACPTQVSLLEERPPSWTTWFLKICWMPTYFLSTFPGISDTRSLEATYIQYTDTKQII